MLRPPRSDERFRSVKTQKVCTLACLYNADSEEDLLPSGKCEEKPAVCKKASDYFTASLPLRADDEERLITAPQIEVQ